MKLKELKARVDEAFSAHGNIEVRLYVEGDEFYVTKVESFYSEFQKVWILGIETHEDEDSP